MMNLIFLADASSFCSSQAVTNIMYLVGLIIFGIKVAVPIILVVIGMTKMLSAISHQDDKEVKKAQEALVQKAVAAVVVFLMVTIVGLLMGVIGGKQYAPCMPCINDPFNATSCKKNFEKTDIEDVPTGLDW